MRTPRVTDFDPNAKAPQLKSSLENMPAIGKPKPATSPPVSQTKAQKPSVAAKPATTLQPGKRHLVRRTFDFYEDQIEYMKRESLQERLAGRETGMNSMMREAIDDWIKKRSSGK